MKFTVNTQFESGFLSPSYQIFPNKTLIMRVHWDVTTLKVKIFVQWPFGDQLFGFSRQGKFLGAKLY